MVYIVILGSSEFMVAEMSACFLLVDNVDKFRSLCWILQMFAVLTDPPVKINCASAVSELAFSVSVWHS